ncbi:peptide-methionine (S)-S-oxide reductase [Marinitoga sp. 1154]
MFCCRVFLGIEHLLKKLNGVVETKVGYMGEHLKN